MRYPAKSATKQLPTRHKLNLARREWRKYMKSIILLREQGICGLR